MAKINDNPLVKGARGNVGRQFVFKKRGNSTYIAKMPAINENAVATEKQAELRDLFSSASLYAQGAISSPGLKKKYAKKATEGKTAYNVALRDYMKAPVVKKIDTGRYDGSPGSVIVIKARDDFRVVEVRVTIRTPGGTLVEEGNAILNPVDRHKWIYTVLQTNETLAGTLVSATASDLPGNKAMVEVSI